MKSMDIKGPTFISNSAVSGKISRQAASSPDESIGNNLSDSVTINNITVPKEKPAVEPPKNDKPAETPKTDAESHISSTKTQISSPPSIISEVPEDEKLDLSQLSWNVPPPAPSKDDLRKEAIGMVQDIENHFNKGELSGPEFTGRVSDLSFFAHDMEDPLVNKMAKGIMGEWVKGANLFQDWSLKRGPLEGPVSYMNEISDIAKAYWRNDYFSDSNMIPEFLKGLKTVCNWKPVPESALRSVSHFAEIMTDRSGRELDEYSRERETPEMDRKWAEQAADLVDGWWKNNQITVIKDGKKLRPGSFNLSEHIMKNRVPVKGNVIEIVNEPKNRPLPDNQAELLKKLNGFRQEETLIKSLKMLDEMHGEDPASLKGLAEHLVSKAMDQPGRYDELNQLAVLLSASRLRPWLKEELSPQLDIMKNFISEYEARNYIAETNLHGVAKVKFVEDLTEAFPEIITEKYLKSEVLPLLMSDEINTQQQAGVYVSRLWENKPETVKPLADAVTLKTEKPYLDENIWKLLKNAADNYGWMPDKTSIDNLAVRMFNPLGREKETVFSYSVFESDFGQSIRFFSALKDKNPEITDGIILPDTKGNPVSLEDALMDRIINDPSGDMLSSIGFKSSGIDEFKIMKDINNLILSKKETVDKLVGIAEEGFSKTGDICKMEKYQKAALIIGASLDPKSEAGKRIFNILKSAKDRNIESESQGLDKAVNILRRMEAKEIEEELDSGKLSPEMHMEKALELVNLNLHYADKSYGYHVNDYKNSMLKGMSNRMESFREPVKKILDEFREGFIKDPDISKAFSGDMARLMVLTDVAGHDSELRTEFFDLIRPSLADPNLKFIGLTGKYTEKLRKQDITNRIEKINGQVSHKERVQLVEDGITALKSYGIYGIYNESEASKFLMDIFSQWAENARLACTDCPSEDIQQLPKLCRDKTNVFKAYKAIAEDAKDDNGISDGVQLFKQIFMYLDGEKNMDRIVDCFHFVNRQTEDGHDKEKALQHALKSYTAGSRPGPMPVDDNGEKQPFVDVREDEGIIVIDGIKLDINS